MAKKKASPSPDDGPPKARRPKETPDPSGPLDATPSARKRPSPKPKAARPRAVPPPSDLDRARALADRGAAIAEPARRAALARQALALSADCAAAYLILAEDAKTRAAAIGFLEQAVGAEARVLGPGYFERYAGHFWGLIETRGYMRARLALAEALWESGGREAAAGHLAAMLALNPGDNQGLRYILAGWYLNLDRLDDLDDLLDAYDEDGAMLAFPRALAAFRRSGDTPASRKLLAAARKLNKHVVGYLIGEIPLPSAQPAYYGPGDDDEAALYVGTNLGSWRSAPGAIPWVRSVAKPARKAKAPKARKAAAPIAEAGESLRGLPIEDDAWQADFRQFPRRIEVDGRRIRPWMILIASRTRDLVLAHGLTDEEPTPADLWDALARAMARPAVGEPHRPAVLAVRPGPAWDALEGDLGSIGVASERSEVLDQVDFLFDDLSKHLAGSGPPGLLDMPGVTPERVGVFYEAAASFYRRAPWRKLGYESIIRIECDRFESGPWFGVIMGQSGLTLGLALYEDLALLRKMWAGKLTEEEGARKTVALTVTYDDESSLTDGDLEAIEEHSWPVVAPDAFPSIFRKERGLTMRPPLAWEIELMIACLRILPDFVDRRRADDPTRELVPLAGSSPPLELGLSWIGERA